MSFSLEAEKLEESNGYKKLKKSVEHDIADNLKYNKNFYCSFNKNGCNNKGCYHKYCDTFKWVIERATHYAEVLKLSVSEILDIWEEDRDYWYMNYYQDCNQPLLKDVEDVYVFETNNDVMKSFNNKGFRCPNCKGISSHPQICNSKLSVNSEVCDWKSFGLFPFGLVTVVVKKPFSITKIFKPIEWEIKE